MSTSRTADEARGRILVAALFPSSPANAKNGWPSTINCVAFPCFRKCGVPEAVCPQHWTAINAAHANRDASRTFDFIFLHLIRLLPKTALGYEYQISPPDEVPPIAGQKHSSSSLPDRERETRGRPLPPLTFTFHLSSIAPLDNLYFSVYSDLTTDQVNEKGENIK